MRKHLILHPFFQCILILLIMMVWNIPLSAQKKEPTKTTAGFPVNYQEENVGNYILPDLLIANDGQKVTDVKTWEEKRRPEIVQWIEEIQFGKMPSKPSELSYNIFETDTMAFEGKAIRKQVTIYFTGDTASNKMDLLIYLPKKTQTPVPLLLTINFLPNAMSIEDPAIKLGYMWTREGKKILASREIKMGSLDIFKWINKGIGIATVYYGDIEPDFKNGIQYGIRQYYLKDGETRPADNEWGAISAWAWGLSRAMDYFETDKEIDAARIALYGVSRLGKTVLWTGAHDTRFKMVIASCSGEGGAAISRRDYGENIKHLTDTSRYYYQFAANYHKYAYKVDSLPFDAHMLVALMAPRAILLQTGNTDYWSDPKGEFLSAIAAEPVYKLYNLSGPATDQMPAAGDTNFLNPLGYYMHDGGHGPIPSDWEIYLTFIKKYL